MLAVVLHVTLDLLKEGPPDNRDSTLGGILASTLLKVCADWANVHVHVCPHIQFILLVQLL